MRSNERRLAGAVRSDDAEDLAGCCRSSVTSSTAVMPPNVRRSPSTCSADGARRPRGAAESRAPLRLRAVRPVPTAAPAPSRNTERRTSGRFEQFCRRTAEADLALLHEVRRLGERERDVHRLLDEDDRRPAVADRADDPEQLLDDDRREPERELVDHEQARLRDERLPEREHLLLAAGQVARRLLPAIAQDGEEAEDLLGRGFT